VLDKLRWRGCGRRAEWAHLARGRGDPGGDPPLGEELGQGGGVVGASTRQAAQRAALERNGRAFARSLPFPGDRRTPRRRPSSSVRAWSMVVPRPREGQWLGARCPLLGVKPSGT
jgi:hypothetical protein